VAVARGAQHVNRQKGVGIWLLFESLRNQLTEQQTRVLHLTGRTGVSQLASRYLTRRGRCVTSVREPIKGSGTGVSQHLYTVIPVVDRLLTACRRTVGEFTEPEAGRKFT